MNWTVFFSVLISIPLGMAACLGLVTLALWLDDKLGGWWGGAICGAALIVAMAALIGLAA